MSQETQIATENLEAVHTGHPTPATYFKVAMILTVITAVEVGIFYLDFLGYGIIPILTLLSTSKFILVAMYYMHLKFDSIIFSTLFVAGLILAATVVLALLALFSFFN
jgi:cytochrome c oxidase subunit 4